MSLTFDASPRRRDSADHSPSSETSSTDVHRARSFWRSVEHIPIGASVPNAPAGSERTIVVVSGWIAEMRILPDGRRQIFSFLIPGDVAVVSSASHLGDRGLVALTNVEIADAGALSLGDDDWVAAGLRRRQDRIFDHMVRLGRLTATERVLSLLVELQDRLEERGLVKGGAFRIPITQEVFSDALGLSVVHINRTLKRLRSEGVSIVGRGTVTVSQRRGPASAAGRQPDARADERRSGSLKAGPAPMAAGRAG